MLDSDNNLQRVKEVEGYKVLPPCVLYGKIGQGGMGAVYRGRHLNLDIDVAVKCLKPDLTGEDEQFVVRFRREARSAARINHQNVVRVFDVSEEDGLHYIVMELVQGETARQRVQRKGSLTVGEALEILHGAAAGLAEAHSKAFIHRDIKPDNIMIASSGAVKVADLGLAKPSGQSQMSVLSGTNLVMGTPQYMPPEQWENTATVTPAADVWALGATLYYLLVGGEAIAGDSLPRIMQRIVLQPFPDVREAREDVPDDVAEFLVRATAKSPEDRFADAGEMLTAIEALATRRDSLRDHGAVSDGEHNTLLSPPPAKTLAKIKFWLDEQSKPGPSAGADGADGAAAGDGPTMVSPKRRQAAGSTAAAEPGSQRSFAGIAVALLAAAVAVTLAIWQPWRSAAVPPFAEAERLARAGQFERAEARFLEAFAADPGQAGKNERMASLHLAWARSLQTRQDFCGSLQQIATSLGYRSSSEALEQQRAVLAEASRVVEEQLERSGPGVEREPGGAIQIKGRLVSAMVRELLVAGSPVVPQADGTFLAERPRAGRSSLATEARLVSGDTVSLAPWVLLDLAEQVASGNTPGPVPGGGASQASVASKPTASKPTASQPTAAAGDGDRLEDRAGGQDRAQAADANTEPVVAITPALVELVGDGQATLTIEADPEASIRIDGQVVARPAGARQYRHAVRPRQERPADIEVVVTLAGGEARRLVPVRRIQGELVFASPAAFAKLAHRRGDCWATDRSKVEVVGACSDRPTRLLVNGTPVAKVKWQGNRFSFATAVEPGINELRVQAERRFYQSCEQLLVVERVGRPGLVLAQGTRENATVVSDRYQVVVDAGPWTASVEAINGRSKSPLRRDPQSQRFRGEVALAAGENRIVLRARNVLGARGDLELVVVKREGAAGRPSIRGVSALVDGQEIAVRSGKQVHFRGVAALKIDSGKDQVAAATVNINGKPVARQADGSVSLAGILKESKASKIEVTLENAKGRSKSFQFFAWLDTGKPTAKRTDAVAVAKGQPFELRGTWADAGGLDRTRCKLGERTVRLSPRGVAPSGTWKVQHPGLERSTTLQLTLVDRAGNQTVVPLQVTVQ